MVRFRNLLGHFYLEIDNEIIYNILQNNLKDFISFKEVKEFIEGKRDEPWESSNEDFGAYWMMTLKPALMKEIKYGFDALIDFKFIKKQVYNNIFENIGNNFNYENISDIFKKGQTVEKIAEIPVNKHTKAQRSPEVRAKKSAGMKAYWERMNHKRG
ncbi:hypothetical protein LCGC14_0688360 [marine sediment metagenome]|uniref:DUF86 domain-containing protein n=1 Tax=marine sediment metagenome TaxID=412755 RepID=A0A0F9TU78_9ZZZZ